MRISDWSSDVCSSDLACDLLFVNRQEAAALLEGEAAGDAPEALVAALRRAGVAEVVMTLGAAGICVANEKETIVLPSLETRVVDITGAGDDLGAAYLAARLRGLDAALAGRRAAEIGKAGG